MLKFENRKGVLTLKVKERRKVFTKELKLALGIALFFHLSLFILFSVKIGFSSLPPSKTFTLALSHAPLKTIESHSLPLFKLSPPPLKDVVELSTLNLAFSEPIRMEPLKDSLPAFIENSLKNRILSFPPPPEKKEVVIDFKIDDKTGEIFFYQASKKLDRILEKWLFSLRFKPLSSSFVTTGRIIIND